MLCTNTKHVRQIARGAEVRGQRISVACMSWTTSTGEVQPVSFKYQDAEGVAQSIKNINIKRQERCIYFSEPCQVYWCNAIINEYLIEFRLIHFRLRALWEMYIGN